MNPRVATFAALFLAASVSVVAAARRDDGAYVRTVQLHVPEGRDFFEAYEKVRGAEGLPLDDALVKHHVEVLGELGWVSTVDVDFNAAPDGVHFDLVYRLIPRGEVQSIRFEGNEVLDSTALGQAIDSKAGEHFNLRKALDDAHQINLEYQDAGYSFSGVLDSQNVDFHDGILTFKVRESRLAESDRKHLEEALGTRLDGPLNRRQLSRTLAEGDLRDALDLKELDLQVNRQSGELRLRAREEAPVATPARRRGRMPLRSPDEQRIKINQRMHFEPQRRSRSTSGE